MLSPNLSHIGNGNGNATSFAILFKIFIAAIMSKKKVILSEKEKLDRIEFICFLLPLVVTALGIIVMLILYKIYM